MGGDRGSPCQHRLLSTAGTNGPQLPSRHCPSSCWGTLVTTPLQAVAGVSLSSPHPLSIITQDPSGQTKLPATQAGSSHRAKCRVWSWAPGSTVHASGWPQGPGPPPGKTRSVGRHRAPSPGPGTGAGIRPRPRRQAFLATGWGRARPPARRFTARGAPRRAARGAGRGCGRRRACRPWPTAPSRGRSGRPRSRSPGRRCPAPGPAAWCCCCRRARPRAAPRRPAAARAARGSRARRPGPAPGPS